MRDIAEAAGVSHSTVSRALANSPKISKSTRHHVAQVAYDMGYRANPLVSAWMAHVRHRYTGEHIHGTLLYLDTQAPNGNINQSFRTRCRRGAQNRARQLGYHLKTMHEREFSGKLEGLERMIRHGAVDGVILPHSEKTELDYNVDWSWIAASSIGENLVTPAIDRAAADGFTNATLAMQVLRERGFQRIGMIISHFLFKRSGKVWVGAYLAEQTGHPAENLIPPLIVWKHESEQTRVKNWFCQYRPEVIIQCQKFVRLMLEDAGIKAPDDVQYIDMNVNGDLDPLPGIDQNLEEIGAIAVEQVVARLHRNDRGVPPIRRTTLVPGFWREGSEKRLDHLAKSSEQLLAV